MNKVNQNKLVRCFCKVSTWLVSKQQIDAKNTFLYFFTFFAFHFKFTIGLGAWESEIKFQHNNLFPSILSIDSTHLLSKMSTIVLLSILKHLLSSPSSSSSSTFYYYCYYSSIYSIQFKSIFFFVFFFFFYPCKVNANHLFLIIF